MNTQREKIGTVFVDAGLIWVGDPCYIMGDTATNRVVDWSEFVDKLYSGVDNNMLEQPFCAPLGKGIGLAVSSGYGDGVYPVYITRNNEGVVSSLTIEFDEFEDDEFEDDEFEDDEDED